MHIFSKMTSEKLGTFLSPKVHNILCAAGVVDSELDENCIQENHLNFNHISSLLPGPQTEEDIGYYQTCVQALATVFKRSREHLELLSVDDFANRYEKDTEWTSCPELLHKCFEYLGKKDGKFSTLSILMLTSVLERSLGDVFEMKGNQCPSLLKDLLVTPELKDVFGAHVIQVLRIIIGPPISLNIRNVVWHGFAAPGEIPVQYGYFLILMALSLGDILQSKGLQPRDIKHRPLITFPQAELLNGIFPETLDLQVAKNVIESSGFIPRIMLPYVSLALLKFQEECYGECLVLLFPVLENGLRCAFCKANNCEERTMTAESTVLYTTFDEILAPTLPDGTTNKLLMCLGNQQIQMLFDILTYPEGLRLRDRISHGEVDLKSIGQDLARHVIQVIIVLCLREVQEKSLMEDPSIQALIKYSSKYEAVFHPLAFLNRQIVDLIDKVSEWGKLPRPSMDQLPTTLDWADLKMGNCDAFSIYQEALSSLSGADSFRDDVKRVFLQPFHDSRGLLRSYLGSKSASLYRSESMLQPSVKTTATSELNKQPVSVSELTGLLRRIIANGVQVSDNICAVTAQRFRQWEAKELRSRQRNTFKRHLDSIPALSLGLRLVILFVVSTYHDLDVWTSKQLKNQHEHLKLCKFLNQYCENVITFSSSDKNRWEEACILTEKMVTRLKIFFRS